MYYDGTKKEVKMKVDKENYLGNDVYVCSVCASILLMYSTGIVLLLLDQEE